MRNSLETSRKKWCLEENALEAKRKQLTEEMVMKALKSEERRKAFEARWNEIKERNKRALDEGHFEGPIVPIGWVPPEAKGASRDEVHAEQVHFLQALEEPPEGCAKVSEGGSSGSGGAPPPEPPPGPPPAEAPPDEAPVAEVALSKGGDVKHRIAEAPERLEVEAYRLLEDEFIAVAKPEDLRDEDRELYEAVRGVGLGVCARCKWLSGCPSCDEGKAWGFACRSTLWNTASEAVRPKAKPRGRPKKAAP